MAVVQWGAAALLAVSIWWYGETSGWRRIAAPALSVVGCLGFGIVAADAGIWGIAALNLLLVGINARNAWRALTQLLEENT